MIHDYQMKLQFPTGPQGNYKIFQGLFPYVKTFFRRQAKNDLGSLDTPSFFLSKLVTRIFITWNVNHLGNWSGKNDVPWATQHLEREVIGFMADLYGGSLKNVGGYVTSGGSESNIFLLWLGREYLKRKNTGLLCLLRTSLTHYSIVKGAKIVGVANFVVGLHEMTWAIDPDALEKKIIELYDSGYRSFLIPLTLGYAPTGTSDDINVCLRKLEKLQKKMKGIFFYVWIDAALNGLIQPFVDPNFKVFTHRLIQGMVIDFHKFGGVPPTAGLVLHRQNLRSLIETEIPYLRNTDATLLGSRSGIPAIAIWCVIKKLGKKGFQQRAQKCLEKKAYFLDCLKKKNIQYVTDSHSVTIALLRKNG